MSSLDIDKTVLNDTLNTIRALDSTETDPQKENAGVTPISPKAEASDSSVEA